MSSSLGFEISDMNFKDPKTGLPKDGGKLVNRPRDSVEAVEFFRYFFSYCYGTDFDAIGYVKDQLEMIL